MNLDITPVILCGGFGSRLWPLSRTVTPKHLLSLVDEFSMLQNTLLRVHALFIKSHPFIVCNNEHRFVVAEQLAEVGFEQAQIFLEPEGRNTAPAVTMAALQFEQSAEDPVLLIMPADHVIQNHDKLLASFKAGAKLAHEGKMVTFGIVPNRPETGYGYIHKATAIPDSTGFAVQAFVEKPDLQTAESYLATGEYLWNSGMFMFKASTFIAAIKAHAPDIYAASQVAFSVADIADNLTIFNNEFSKIRSESIDFAVMEKADNIAVVPFDAEWSDVGSWDALWELGNKDTDGNVKKGQIFVDKVKNSYLRAEKRLVAVVGLEDIAVIETSDAVLVAHKKNAQEIKTIFAQLQSQHCEEANVNCRVDRPWGYYETLNKSDHFHVKHIYVKPGAKLSLQAHKFRSENWVIIKGTATVTCGDERKDLVKSQAIYIPVGVKHRIENTKDVPLELIEVQTGEYFGEDDIIRFEDIYGRREVTA